MTGIPVPDGLSDAFSRAFMQVTEERFASLPVQSCLVWDVANTPDAALLHIASGLGMTRVLGSAALRVTLPKGRSLMGGRGTRAAVRAALEGLGYGVAFVSGLQDEVRDGSITANGEPYRCGADAHWAVSRIVLTTDRAISVDQISEIWRNVEFWGRKSIRHVLVVTDAVARRTYRDDSITPS